MRYAIAVAALTLAASTAAAQQRTPTIRPEIRPFVGAYVPMGAMRDDFRDATTVGGQAALELSDRWHLVGTLGWTYGKNRMLPLAQERTYLIHYDVGAESNLLFELERSWLIKPFGGLGVGARSYDYNADAIETRICTAGYGALGSEAQRGVIALRFEARQYLACYESPITGEKKTRRDGLFSLGLAYHIR